LDFNLSVSRLDQNGYDIVFRNGQSSLSKNGKIAAIAEKRGRLYFLELLELNSDNCALGAVKTASTDIWHRRLGHLSKGGMSKLTGLVDGFDLTTKFEIDHCETCVEGKQTRLPHLQKRVRAARPLKLVHSDLVSVR